MENSNKKLLIDAVHAAEEIFVEYLAQYSQYQRNLHRDQEEMNYDRLREEDMDTTETVSPERSVLDTFINWRDSFDQDPPEDKVFTDAADQLHDIEQFHFLSDKELAAVVNRGWELALDGEIQELSKGLGTLSYTKALQVIKLGNRFELKLKKQASLSEWIHGAFDILGLIPGAGEVFDAANALGYAIEGDWLLATLSLISMIPEIGDAIGKGSKLSLWITKNAPEATVLLIKHGPDAIKATKYALMLSKKVLIDNEGKLEKLLNQIEDGEKMEFAKKHIGKIRSNIPKILDSFDKSQRLVDSINRNAR